MLKKESSGDILDWVENLDRAAKAKAKMADHIKIGDTVTETGKLSFSELWLL